MSLPLPLDDDVEEAESLRLAPVLCGTDDEDAEVAPRIPPRKPPRPSPLSCSFVAVPVELVEPILSEPDDEVGAAEVALDDVCEWCLCVEVVFWKPSWAVVEGDEADDESPSSDEEDEAWRRLEVADAAANADDVVGEGDVELEVGTANLLLDPVLVGSCESKAVRVLE